MDKSQPSSGTCEAGSPLPNAAIYFPYPCPPPPGFLGTAISVTHFKVHPSKPALPSSFPTLNSQIQGFPPSYAVSEPALLPRLRALSVPLLSLFSLFSAPCQSPSGRYPWLHAVCFFPFLLWPLPDTSGCSLISTVKTFPSRIPRSSHGARLDTLKMDPSKNICKTYPENFKILTHRKGYATAKIITALTFF